MNYIPKNKIVRDLWWLLESPHLISAPHYYSLPVSLDEDDWKKLDQNPQALVHKVSKATRRTLGSYAENLFHYALSELYHASDIFHSIQLTNHQKTLGEIDFIYQLMNMYYHTELSVKFFLHEPQRNQLLGAKLKDTLDRRFERFKSQINLLKTSEGKAFLAEHELPTCKPNLLFKGYFFYPLSYEEPVTNLHYPMTDRRIRYHWCEVQDLPHLPHQHGALLAKRQWLSPSLQHDDIHIKPLNELQNAAYQRLNDYEHSIVMSVFDGDEMESTRYMVVPDGWPNLGV